MITNAGLVTNVVIDGVTGSVTEGVTGGVDYPSSESYSDAFSGLPTVTNLLAGALLLTALLIVWRRELRPIVILLGVQGAILAALPIIYGVRSANTELIVVGIAVLLMRALLLPTILVRAVTAGRAARRETRPLVDTAPSLLVCAVLIVVAFAVTAPIVELQPTASVRAAPAAFAVLLVAVFTMAARRQALSQVVGFLMLDNAITAGAFLLTGGVPLVVELGASLDVLFAVLVLGLLATHMHRVIGDTDVHLLQELRD